MSFHGSYRPEQVTFLLKPMAMQTIADMDTKEHLIQTGQKHYSEMLTPEKKPSAAYLQLFHEAHAANRERMAKDVLQLAALIVQQRPNHAPTLVSLARAGTPIGVILQQFLSHITETTVAHYSISIIRDRGIDTNALHSILAAGCAPKSLTFIDGWTGKGVINRELQQSIAAFNAQHQTHIDSRLFVLTDLAGVTPCAVSHEDYLIPSSILNSTISGLISRSILNEHISVDDYHGCVYFEAFESCDLSQWFVNDILQLVLQYWHKDGLPDTQLLDVQAAEQKNQTCIATLLQAYGIEDVNLIKPGIGESTRVLLRRLPERLLVRDMQDINIQHLLRLAQEKGVMVMEQHSLPYHAVAIIKSIRDA